MFGRRKSADRPAGEPTPASGRVRPEESVLDELSRVFGAAGDDPDDPDDLAGQTPVGRDDNAALIADDDLEADPDDTVPTDVDPLGEPIVRFEPVEPVPSAPVELSIVTSDGPVPAAGAKPEGGAPVGRRTIRIGDDFGDGVVDSIPVAEALGRADRTDRPGRDDRDDGIRDVVVTERRSPSERSTVAIGGHDDLPDAVYLDGGLDDDAGTVFIDDDGVGDAIAVKDATTPGIEPRLRQRRIGVNRAANRKRIKWVVLGGLGLVLVLGVLTVLGSGWFAIDDVDVTGAVYTDENRLEVVIEELVGTPTLLADTEQAERDLEAIPWVDDARVRVKFPHSATIEIRERTPVATMAGVDGRFRVLDAEGRVLDVIEGQPVAFVLLGGPSTLDLAAGEFAPLGPASAASLVTKLTPTIRPRVLSIDVTDDGSDLVMYLAPDQDTDQTTPIRVRFGSANGDSDQIDKLVWLEDRLGDLPDGTITEINVATNEVTTL